jgi:glycosyltransferase involved in cell wall biosynthesis
MFHRFGCPVTYTAAAHSIEESKREHNELGIPYNYPHLTDPALWNRYVQGYLDADVLVCPSHHSAEVMRGFGARNRIEVIPHGCRIPEEVHPLPRTFTVGYLGAAGPDKGLRYLFAAWKKLNYRDAVLKIGGRDSTTGYMQQLWNAFGGGNVQFCGWQENAEDFYGSLSCYVQPSVSEGFGMEVIEAMACGRNVICSKGAGASDAVSSLWIYDARNVDRLAYLINDFNRLYGYKRNYWIYFVYWKRSCSFSE